MGSSERTFGGWNTDHPFLTKQARALKFACSTDARLKDQLPSTKGLL